MSQENIPSLKEVQDNVHAALDFANQVGELAPSHVQRNKAGLLERGSSETRDERDTNVEYRDFVRPTEKDTDGKWIPPSSPSDRRETEAQVKVPQGTYRAGINLTHPQLESAGAEGKREGYGVIKFSRKDHPKAAALVTSLAAKRVATDAMTRVDEVAAANSAAKDTYLKRTSK